MYNEDNEAIVDDCVFAKNAASDNGGGMYNDYVESASLTTSCVFWDNNSVDHGGGIGNRDSDHEMANCTFFENEAGGDGGAIWNDDSDPDMSQLANCILWDGGNEIWSDNNSTITITYSDVQGTWPGQGNIEADPCFAEPGYWDSNGTPGDANDDYWVDGDYHLKSEGGRWDPNAESWVLDDVTSACIDKGDCGAAQWAVNPIPTAAGSIWELTAARPRPVNHL